MGRLLLWARRDKLIAFYLVGIMIMLALIIIVLVMFLSEQSHPVTSRQLPNPTQTIVLPTETPFSNPLTIMPNQGRDNAPPPPPTKIVPIITIR
ncbi:MAG: hypothetical protein HXX08_18240 [Chloroflexi bacterium]|uniref:Uncharacterized protein n=1 Tax=Candidatus Chlorohelix allophototropha TaxID=3003348 RepID=A0A8T7M6P0_9CHLR|nr:hypothetical protein [Chloroflexota bacterium]WJW69702.1 hypothetical protein OZ401_003330 [Chloroflexota bacterium L227-S17]